MECGRVFRVNQADNISFFIKCDYCNEKYEWTDYVNHHFQSDHMSVYGHGKESHTESIGVIEEEEEEEFKTESDGDMEEEEHLEEYSHESEHDLDGDVDLEIYNDAGKSSSMKVHNLPPALNRPFFRLRKTPTNIMLQFIDLLSHHPLQWDIKNPDFAQKDRRDESSLALSLQIRQHLNLHISPQGARSSALALIRWFEREYIRFLACEEQDLQFICVRAEYFEKLLQFLPYKHLQALVCQECQRRFKSEHLLLVHKHKHHNGQVPLTCRYCGRGFIHPSSHKMHENRHTKILLWPCTECLYQAASKADYHKHLATHSPEQPFKCDVCGLAYKTSTNLNVHKKSHSLAPEYECKICKKQFYEKYRYKRHQWIHEVKSSVESFKCSICGRRFTSKNTLLKHQVVHMLENYNLDGEEVLPQSVRANVERCDYCSLEFINNDAYEAHMGLKHKMEIKRNLKD